MFIKRRVELKKEFDSKERAEGFAAGLEFSGNRDFRFKKLYKEKDNYIVLLEKLERSKV